MGVSRIEQLIEDIYEFVESCRMQPLSSSKVIVPKDELYDLLDELRLRTPDEIKRYQKIISNRDAIIADAEEKAQTILAQAKEDATSLMNEHEIMQQAYYQANELVNQATAQAETIRQAANNDADQIRSGALAYANDMLGDVENILSNAFESSRSKYDALLNSIRGNLEIVQNNRRELVGDNMPAAEAAEAVDQQIPVEEVPMEQQQPAEEDFQFDENTFIDGIEQ